MSGIAGDGNDERVDSPLLIDWDTPFQVPPFSQISPIDFKVAFDAGLEAHLAEIETIIADGAPATFEGVIVALERAGKSLNRVARTFFNLSGAHTNDALQEIERDMAPRLSAHSNKIYLSKELFEKVDKLWEERDRLGLNPEQLRLLERYHQGFVRSGAKLDEAGKKRAGEISERMAILTTQFSQNVLKDESDFVMVLESEEDLQGLPDFAIEAASREAEERGHPGKHVITLARSSVETFLQFSSRRDLREKAFRAWASRGENGGDTDNRALISEIAALRAERAKLLGFDNFAAFKLDDTMAKTPDAVEDLLQRVWGPAVAQANEEREALQALVQDEGGNFDLAPYDWRYYAEKLRKRDHDLNEEEIKPYIQLDKMVEAAFYAAERLFGVKAEERFDIPTYHEDVRVFEITHPDRGHVGLFIGDYFARPSKRSGAWMSSFRGQRKLDEDIRPLIVNVMNFSKGGGGKPALLSFDDALTLFHEFGHGLHGLLSNVTYGSLAGTSVSTDFVELPSQLFEHWLWQPEVLKRFAVHYETGEPIPDDLIERIIGARNFNQGFATVEYLSCAILDMDLHKREALEGFEAGAFEKERLADIGMPAEIIMRHRMPHFSHIFSGDHYAAGYYSYMWSEVMDADAFSAFEEAGDIFDEGVAKRLHDHIYSSGGSMDPAGAYEAFRGRMPSVEALLKKRGFA